jgi:hypothetical protein
MNPRGFILGLGLSAALIAGAFVVRGNPGAVFALINSAAQPVVAAIFLSK